jgi:1A family penicillin-binding protein
MKDLKIPDDKRKMIMKWFLYIVEIFRLCLYSTLIVICLGSLIATLLIFNIAKDLPKLPAPLSRIIEIPQTRIIAANGRVLKELSQRKTVPLHLVSPDFINAILATEDHLFFKHKGINKLRILRALHITLTSQYDTVQGASTITQQLAKNLFFTFERTFSRKFKEFLVALQIEAGNTKEEILEAYVNQIYFGAGAQGIESAANIFFGKSALNLTLSESALLAALPRSPNNYNPFLNYNLSLKRRGIVLKRMLDTGFIKEAEAEKALQEKPILNYSKNESDPDNYFLDALIKELISLYGEDIVYYGGIRVFSTIDPELQNLAQQSLTKGMENMDALMGIAETESILPQGALVAIETGTGAVRALIGGRNYNKSEFNRAIKGGRQPGSGFKPFLYYTALKELGYHPGTIMRDQPVSIPIKGAPDWEPRNFKKEFSGRMILKKALTDSVNTIAAQLVEQVGPGAVIKTAQNCGIKSPLEHVYSIALGTSDITPLEMASAYSVFATMGIYHEPYLIRRIEDSSGKIIFEHIVQEKRVLDPVMSYQLVDMMKSVIDNGSGASIRRSGFTGPAAGKTGTSDNYKDAWFTGFTPTICTSVWLGFDKEKTLIDKNGIGITGGRGAAPIWADFMIKALRSEPERDFNIPENIHFETVNVKTGCTATDTVEKAETMTIALKPDQYPCRDK